ncbi:HET-domain-containing protein [Ophiobolus disseminans]|uniref:HET-domain-containing protein n=1 Tax=Ophiobolus disseminans TaxID=1469910 RepID=A0A6A6ZW45_9PLEO|nr:HET-domain-containing protein [Ophiobolus disseminans]
MPDLNVEQEKQRELDVWCRNTILAFEHEQLSQQLEDTSSAEELIEHGLDTVCPRAVGNTSGSVCDTCANIQWDCLATPAKAASVVMPAIEKTFSQLILSPCSIDRFLGHLINSRLLPHTRHLSRPPYRLVWQSDASEENPNYGILSIQGERSFLAQGLHVLVSAPPAAHVPKKSESIVLGDMPLDLVKGSIARCESKHRYSCSPTTPGILQNFRVLDCRSMKVVPAPLGCRYVALSYVWGQNTAVLDAAASLKHDKFPKTISDSCFVAQSLGYNYLWVDRFCIDQADHCAKHQQVAQMANIYSAAQLTIIAAAGDNPDHGLPGVRRQPADDVYQTHMRSVQLQRYPAPFQLEKLQRSTWASRAWTYQECYFSRRRLIFTDDKVAYICNGSPQTLWIKGWFQNDGFHGEGEHRKANDLLSVMNMLCAYTGRHLTYEMDALAAIVGGLSTFRSRSIQHIWGVPWYDFGLSLSENERGEIALLWSHHRPCTRRTAFPSWSPVAWYGRISWTPGDAASTWIIRPRTHWDRTNGSSLPLAAVGSALEDMPRYLEITARIAPLTLMTIYGPLDQNHLPRRQEILVAIPLGKDLNILARPLWDVRPFELHPTNPVLGLLFNAGLPSRDESVDTSRTLILLIQRGDTCFERIGILQFNRKLLPFPRALLHRDSSIIFFHASSGKISGIGSEDLGSWGALTIHAEDSRMLAWRNRGWLPYFVEDTIVLG